MTFLQSDVLSLVRRHACVQLACFSLDVLSACSFPVCIQLSCLHSVVTSAFRCPVSMQTSYIPLFVSISRLAAQRRKATLACPREAITSSRGAKSTPCTGMSLFTCTIITGFPPFPTYKQRVSPIPNLQTAGFPHSQPTNAGFPHSQPTNSEGQNYVYTARETN